jgi:transposase
MIGLTKKGKGNKIMAICDANGLLISLSPGSASPHESSLVDTTIAACSLKEIPSVLVGDKAYDSDKLDSQLKRRGIHLIAPNKANRTHNHEDGRSLRRYRRRWKIERCFAWLQNYRKVATRFETKFCNWVGYILLAASNLTALRVLR